MSKGTAAKGKNSKGKTHIMCRRCGGHSYHKTDKVCSSCGYGNGPKQRSYAWQKKN